jgi:hypothetical protein
MAAARAENRGFVELEFGLYTAGDRLSRAAIE